MKKKLLIGALTVACACACAFGLAACGDEAEGDGHHFAEAWSSNPTYHWHVCEDEDCKEETERIAHTWNEGTVETPATCTAKGSAKYTCTVCGYEESREVAALSHDYVYIETEYTHKLVCSRGDDDDRYETEYHDYAVISEENGAVTIACETCGHENGGVRAGTYAEPLIMTEAQTEYHVYLQKSDLLGGIYTETCFCSFTPACGMSFSVAALSGYTDARFTLGEPKYDKISHANYIEQMANGATVSGELIAGRTYYLSFSISKGYDLPFAFSVSVHNHEYDTATWQQDDSYHWRAALCHEEDAEVAKEMHSYTASGCTVCHRPVPAATNSLTYTYSSSAPYTATVTGISDTTVASVVIPETVEHDGKTYTVTEIAANAFKDNTAIASITLPATLTKIGKAFSGCTSLTKLYLYDLEAYANIERAKTAKTANPFNASDGGEIYLNFEKVEDVTLNMDTDITPWAFYKCNSLKTLTVNATQSAQEGDGIKISQDAFDSCTNLESVILNEGVTELGDSAFAGCTKLHSVTFPESFVGNENNFNIFKSTALKNVYVTDLAKYAQIQWCWSSFTHPFDINAAAGENHLFINDVELTGTLNFGDYGITEIGLFAFSGCKAITAIDLTGVTTIGANAFANAGITSLTLSESMTDVGYLAFQDCLSLESVVIGASVENLSNVFWGCAALKRVDLLRTTDFTDVDADLFNGCENSSEFVINFAGTQEEYDAMTKFKAAVSGKIPNATVNYEVNFD